MIYLKRIYDKPQKSDGYRILVDRLWPRGVSKEKASLNLWLRDIAPSNELRKWFAHDPKKWPEFQEKYRLELSKNPALENLKDLVRKHKSVTILFAAKDEERNEAVVIKNLL